MDIIEWMKFIPARRRSNRSAPAEKQRNDLQKNQWKIFRRNGQLMRVVGVDVGYRNLGLAEYTYTGNGEGHLSFKKRIDISEYACRPNCRLHHSSHSADYISHFIANYSDLFESAEAVVIERQPPGGLQAVEALLYSALRGKAVLVNPISLHKHFQYDHLDYEERKEEAVRIAGLSGPGRLHDIADAVLLARYYVDRVVRPIERRNMPVEDLDRFKY